MDKKKKKEKKKKKNSAFLSQKQITDQLLFSSFWKKIA